MRGRAMRGQSWEAMARMIDENAEKAQLWDALVARIEAGEWTMPDGVDRVTILIRRTGERVHGATLEEAVRKAMETEGCR